MRSTWNKLAALLLAVSLLGGGAIAASAAMNPSKFLTTSQPGAQQAPDATSDDAMACVDEQTDDQAESTTEQDDQGEAENSDEGDADEVDQNEENEDDEDAGDSGSEAAPGELSEGQDLLPQATVTLDQAVATAQGTAIGSLGSVELKQRDGALVFEVSIGDQDVLIDATSGAVVGQESSQDNQHENECDDDETTVAAGTLDDGADLLPKANISVDEAISVGQTAAAGDIGEIDLEYFEGTLVFNVDVGDQDVKVDARDGSVLGIESED